MILGIGTDIVDIQRIESILDGEAAARFQEKYFHPTEIKTANKFSDLKGKASSFAKRFAAKEAFVKALGTGVREGVKLNDIYVINDTLGCPSIELSKTVQSLLEKKSAGKVKIDLSLSDQYPMALAFVVISLEN
jgi:holo-[acyl-carrier protein] synthase